jgi:hypothetical protein
MSVVKISPVAKQNKSTARRNIPQISLKQLSEEAVKRLQDPDDCFVGLDQIKAGIRAKRSIQLIPAASSRPRKAISQTRQ